MKKYLVTLSLFLSQAMAFGQEAATTSTTSTTNEGDAVQFFILCALAIILIFPIILLGKAVIDVSLTAVDKYKAMSKKTLPFIVLGFLCFNFQEAYAADFSAAVASWHFPILVIILIELAVILYLAFILRKVTNSVLKSDEQEQFEALSPKEQIAIEDAKLTLEHEYDGIRELDNDLPPWWKYLFYATILFGAFYFYYYDVSGFGPSQEKEYNTEIEAANAEKMKFYANSPDMQITAETAKVLTESSDIETGKGLFVANCSACHAADGGGVVGPNLVDDYWIHGGSTKDIFHTISEGVLDKGMPSWKQQLNPKQIEQVLSFIKSIHGSKPASAKEPQGDLYKEEAAPVAASTAAVDSTASTSTAK